MGILGSAILIVGVFMPVFRTPIVGTLNYFQNGEGYGTVILVLAAVGLFFAVRREYALLGIPALFSLGLLTVTFINYQERLAEARAGIESGISGNPFPAMTDVGLSAIQLQWGWVVLLLGAVLQVAAAGIKTE